MGEPDLELSDCIVDYDAERETYLVEPLRDVIGEKQS